MADKDKKELLWLAKYPISDEDDIHSLDTRAAIHEFQGKLPRHEAEAQAHSDYKKESIVNSCAHHYSGVMASHAAGDTESSKKHALMLSLGLKALGHDGIKVPDEVVNRAKHTPSKVYAFKNHKSDGFLLNTDKSKESTSDKDK